MPKIPPMSPLVKSLKSQGATSGQFSKNSHQVPVWKGPEVDGITYSLLCRFLNCRERFRLLVIEGLQPQDGFNHRIEYGSMWHVCEQALADGGLDWQRQLLAYCRELARKYKTSQEQIDHWYNVCKAQFPLYMDYWAKHPDVKERKPILQEEPFSVPYKLPSGRKVLLRGKWDSVDLIGKGRTPGVYLQENKSKGDIRPEQVVRQLTFDLQTMIYLIALQEDREFWTENNDVPGDSRLCGVRYNVIRRPLSGGKGTIVRHKPSKSNPQGESKEAYYQRVAEYIKDDPSHYFMRWKVEVSPADVERFQRESLDPILENLCYWWEGQTDYKGYGVKGTEAMGVVPPSHWRHPFGVWNVLDEGGSSDLDEYLASGSEVGLTRTTNLFPELTNA